MARKRTNYVCQECGYEVPQWIGKCPECGLWNTFEELLSERTAVSADKPVALSAQEKSKLKPVSELEFPQQKRIKIGLDEMDRVCGGGIYPHTTVLLAGEPGIGKSTVLLQISSRIAESTGNKVLYIAAEESLQQVRQRFLRLKLNGDTVFVIAESDISAIQRYIQELAPTVVIIDSVQAVSEAAIPSPPGTLVQVRESALRLCRMAKENGFILFLVGHVTKEGVLAGPKSLEHLVDTVLYFEGERYQSLRILRTIKNRFGSTGELGVFEMTQDGLVEVTNPSEIFLSDSESSAPGRVSVAVMEGRRPFLVEIQALTNKTAFNMPLRRSVGIELNKITLLLAVIERNLALPFHGFDVFVKAVGGLRLTEAACDLAVACSILSSFNNQCIPADTVVIGEVGLSGEIRKVRFLNARINEALRLGFKNIVIPKNAGKQKGVPADRIVAVSTLSEVYDYFFKSNKRSHHNAVHSYN